ncbi:hypothetical protein LCGC14_1129980 [marine sediment metagenome]|uniref:Uncharacterized protein n=1 Tax=marine sediment metagenome TaxID=412755 RepID=A0A0F9M688_9ZZZZ
MIDTDAIFKFKIGQWVRPVGTVLPDGKGCRWPATGETRYVVQECHLQQCHGGVQLIYRCKVIHRDGGTTAGLWDFTEPQLDPSRSYTDDPKPEKPDA